MMTIRTGSRLLTEMSALALSVSLARGAHAQNPPAPAPPPTPATVSGAIVDSAGVPIPHAVLSVVGESLRVVTDSEGRFHLAVPPGPRLLAARALGFRPLMWSVTLVSGQEASGRIRLARLSVVLREINVVAQPYEPSRLSGFYQRKRIGFGKYIDPETIRARFTNSIADLLQGIAGVRVRPSSGDPFRYFVSFARCNRIAQGLLNPASSRSTNCLPPGCGATAPPAPDRPGDAPTVGVYVDGFRVPGDPGDILAMINPSDVEAIEVYRGPAELPAEFMSDDCAAIVIWTKY